MENDREYYAVLEDGFAVLIEITEADREIINKKYNGDEEDFFYEVVCARHLISVNNCQWTTTCESQIVCYGTLPKIIV